MQTKTEITVEVNKNNTRYIGAGSYIVSLYSIRTKKLDTGETFLEYPIVFNTINNEQRVLLEVENKEDNFPNLDYDDNVELSRLIRKLADLDDAYVCLRYEGIDIPNQIVELSKKYIERANALLTRASSDNFTILQKPMFEK